MGATRTNSSLGIPTFGDHKWEWLSPEFGLPISLNSGKGY